MSRWMAMPFGKYRGLPVPHLPEDYLRWLLDQPGVSVDVKNAAREALDVDLPEDDTEPDPSSAAVALPAIVFEWQQRMEELCVGDDSALTVVRDGLELLKQLCSKYTGKPWPTEIGGGA